MQKVLPFLVWCCIFFKSITAQDTFSIVAVDSVTGEVGSAGASCLEAPNPPLGCRIISDIIPGKGAIHTQPLWNEVNQMDAHGYMEGGYSPQEILNELINFDVFGTPEVRQYGIVDFDSAGHPRAVAYTGSSCQNHKGHIVGGYYAIQGNILLDEWILDSMQARFLNTSGTLADKLMAALQGANIPGADSRCLNEGVPAQSAFVRVAKPTDSDTALFLDLLVQSRPYGVNPIDSLQKLYTAWKENLSTGVGNADSDVLKIFPNPARDFFCLQLSSTALQTVEVYNALGVLVYSQKCFLHCRIPIVGWQKGLYVVCVGSTMQKLIKE